MRRAVLTVLLSVLVLVAGVGLAYTVVTRGSAGADAGHGRPGATTPRRPAPPPSIFPPVNTTFLGVQTKLGPYDFADLDSFTAATGYHPAVMQFTQDWAHDKFTRYAFDQIAQRNMLPMLSWEPWDYAVTGSALNAGDQPGYRLSRIAGGAFDAYISSWAEGIKSLGYPVAVRFAHEMNGFWYPWCEQSNGNRPGDYVRAYRHVHDVFTRVGASNVIWVWSPNVTYPGATSLRGLYPGDAYVDWVGLSGYYGTAGMASYEPFSQIFGYTFTQLHQFTAKPIVITETGATDASGMRARWVRQMFAELPRYPFVIGVIWFEAVKELDWRLSSTPAAAAAFRAGAAQPRYQVTWSTNTVPLLRLPVSGADATRAAATTPDSSSGSSR